MSRTTNGAFLSLLLVFVLSTVAQADLARYSNESMAAGGGARALAMGSAFTALADDAWALFWNPAGLYRIDHNQAGLMHSERFGGVVDYDAGVFAQPRPDGSVWSAGFLRLGVNGIPFTGLEDNSLEHSESNRVIVTDYVNEAEYAFFIAQARSYKHWRWGVAPKLLFRHFGSEYRAYGLGVDAGVAGRPLTSIPIDVGIAVRDMLGTVLAWEQTGRKEVIPPTIRLGFAGTLELPKLEATLTPAVDVSYRSEVLGDSDAAALHMGFEYLVKHMVALRVGSNDGNLTLGGGLNLRTFAVDYAFTGHEDLGDTHRISLIVKWGVKTN